MAILFLDTTYDISLGLLSEDLNWFDFRQFQGVKASVVLQQESYSLLKAYDLKSHDISAIISVAGPGFYTGLRLSEGFADVFRFFKVPHYSFLSYSIPVFRGVKDGIWMTKAYRGEYFFHHWAGLGFSNELVQTKDIESYVKKIKGQIYIHSPQALDEQSIGLLNNPISTQQMLREEPSRILNEVIHKKLHRDSFYFRAPEDEFKVSL